MSHTRTTTNAYDDLLYPNLAYAQTHPDRLATIATLAGMSPAPAGRCRVLEFACGDGTNIVPMSLSFPESEFVGIDLAARPIESGTETIRALGLRNITLHRLDLMQFPPGFGEFDYIIAHGLYSWVPDEVRDRLLALCRAHLAPQGVAYVSYNCHPGFHLRQITRDMMLFHVRETADAAPRLEQARALINWLASAQRGSSCYQALIEEQSKNITRRSDGALFHDDLAEINSPLYFHEFVSHAARHGLKFLSEADYFEMRVDDYPPAVAAQLSELARQDFLAKEQYLDFIKGRAFRQTLLCRSEVEPVRAPAPELVARFYLSSPAVPDDEAADIESEAVVDFSHPKEGKISTSFALAKAALLCLGDAYPRALPFGGLLSAARARLGRDAAAEPDEDSQALAGVLLKTYEAGVVDLHLTPPRFAHEPGERPLASPLARRQVGRDAVLTTLRHDNLKIEDRLGRELLMLLDGTRDRHALAEALRARVEADAALRDEVESMEGGVGRLLANLPDELESNLRRLALLGLLLE